MNLPIGASMQLALGVADGLATIPCLAIHHAWEHWLGPGRYGTKLKRLGRRGLLTFVSAPPNMEQVVRLTAAGRAAAWAGRDPEQEWQRGWDGYWRVAVFDIPENRRALRQRLRRKLARLHFGYLQDSVWITPHSVPQPKGQTPVKAVDFATLGFLAARPAGGVTDAKLVAGAWNFRRINQRYENYLEVLRDRRRMWGQSNRQAWLQVESRAWADAVNLDPMLPECLLPVSYLGREAWAQRKRVFAELLAKYAHR